MFHKLLEPFLSPVATVVRAHCHIPKLSMDEAVHLFAAFTVFWCVIGVWAYFRFARRKSDEYGSRVVSVLHALISVTICSLAAVEEFNEPGYATLGTHGTGLQQVAMLVSAGYFAMDMLGMFLSSYFSWLYVGHHILSGGCLLFGGLLGIHGFELVLATAVMESSNPFLHTRWVLIADKEHLQRKGRGSLAYRCVDLCFYVVYFAARIAIGPVMTWNVCTAASVHLVVKAAGLMFQVMSVQFMMVTYAKRFRGELWIN